MHVRSGDDSLRREHCAVIRGYSKSLQQYGKSTCTGAQLDQYLGDSVDQGSEPRHLCQAPPLRDLVTPTPRRF